MPNTVDARANMNIFTAISTPKKWRFRIIHSSGKDSEVILFRRNIHYLWANDLSFRWQNVNITLFISRQLLITDLSDFAHIPLLKGRDIFGVNAR